MTGATSRLARAVGSVQNFGSWGIAFLLCAVVILLSLSLPMARGLICGTIALGAAFLVFREAWRAIDAKDGLAVLHRERATSTSFLGVILSMWAIVTTQNQILPLAIITIMMAGLHWWNLRRTAKWIAAGTPPPERLGTFAFVKESIAQARAIGEEIAARRNAGRSEKSGRNG